MRLGELAYPDNKTTQNPNKISRRTSVQIHHEFFQFFLPSHKADKFFEGNIIMLPKITPDGINLFRYFAQYINSHDITFPYSSPLWLRKDGSIPTRSFFIQRLRLFFTNDVGGQSLRAGGATALAENGTAPSLIQASGRWSSDAFRIYVRKNPVMIQALLHVQNSTDWSPNFIVFVSRLCISSHSSHRSSSLKKKRKKKTEKKKNKNKKQKTKTKNKKQKQKTPTQLIFLFFSNINFSPPLPI